MDAVTILLNRTFLAVFWLLIPIYCLKPVLTGENLVFKAKALVNLLDRPLVVDLLLKEAPI